MKGEADIAAATGNGGFQGTTTPSAPRGTISRLALLALGYLLQAGSSAALFENYFFGYLVLIFVGNSILLASVYKRPDLAETRRPVWVEVLTSVIILVILAGIFLSIRNTPPSVLMIRLAALICLCLNAIQAFLHFRHIRHTVGRLAGAILILSFLGATPAHGHLGTAAFNQAAWDAADLVVIALPLGSRDEPELEPMLIGYHAISVETRFRVVLVLKGDAFLTAFTMHHYREGENPLVSTAGVSYQLWLVARNSKGSSPASPMQAWVGV